MTLNTWGVPRSSTNPREPSTNPREQPDPLDDHTIIVCAMCGEPVKDKGTTFCDDSCRLAFWAWMDDKYPEDP